MYYNSISNKNLLILFFLLVMCMQNILDKITRTMFIGGDVYSIDKVKDGESVTISLYSNKLNDLQIGQQYIFIIDCNYIENIDVQRNFSAKWNNNKLLTKSCLQGNIVAIRSNMICVQSKDFDGWKLMMYIKEVL